MIQPFNAVSGLVLRRSRTLIVAAGAFAMLAVLFGGGGVGLDNALRTTRNALRAHDASGDVHIVEIDKRSIQAIRKWPWPRRYHAQLIDRLRAAGAESIAFDVDFSSESTPEDDRLLAEALARAQGSVVLPTLRQAAGAGATGFIDDEPIALLRQHAFVGAVSMQPDGDGNVRSAPLGMVINGAPRPSLAALVANARAPGTGSFTIDYAIRPASIPRHSFIDVIQGRTPASALAGKRIIVGATAVETGDRYAVPGHGVIFGAVIQALAAETLMAGKPRDLGWMPPLLLAAFAIALLRSRARRSIRIGGFVAAGVAVLLLPLALESFASLTTGIVPALAAMTASGAAAAVASLLMSMRRRTMINAETGLPNLNALAEDIGTPAGTLVAVARIEGFAATASAIGPAATADLVRRIAERVAYATRGATVHRVDESTLAWPADPGDLDEIGGRFDALAMLMRAPVEAGGRRVDVAVTFGVAAGIGIDRRQLVANATHAASTAAEAGERWRMFTRDNEADAHWRLSLLGELDAALEAATCGSRTRPNSTSGPARDRQRSAGALATRHARPIPPDLFIPMVEAHAGCTT
jgi:CHASE2 domain-containing sensor protein